jgi:hypothetical protein
MSAKPQIAAFPKGWIKDLVAPDKLSIYEWIDMAGAMEIPGLEMYNNFHDFKDPANWPKIRKYVEAAGMTIPMQSSAAYCRDNDVKILPAKKEWATSLTLLRNA